MIKRYSEFVPSFDLIGLPSVVNDAASPTLSGEAVIFCLPLSLPLISTTWRFPTFGDAPTVVRPSVLSCLEDTLGLAAELLIG